MGCATIHGNLNRYLTKGHSRPATASVALRQTWVCNFCSLNAHHVKLMASVLGFRPDAISGK